MDVDEILGIDDGQYITQSSTLTFSKGIAKITSPFKKFPSKFNCDSPAEALFSYIEALETHRDGVGVLLEVIEPRHQWFEKDGWHVFYTTFGIIRTQSVGCEQGPWKIAINFQGPGLLHSREEYISDLKLAKKRALRQYVHSLELLLIEAQEASSMFKSWTGILPRNYT